MTPSLLALSLSSSFTQIGAIAAFAALVGIAVLSLLFFSQARELKRLREWAGRAPERAADLEQRVSAEAAARPAAGSARSSGPARAVAAVAPSTGGRRRRAATARGQPAQRRPPAPPLSPPPAAGRDPGQVGPPRCRPTPPSPDRGGSPPSGPAGIPPGR